MINPPKKAIAFLRWFCREDYLDEIEGDLLEIYIKQVESSPRKAKWKFTWSVIKYFRPEFIKSFKNSNQLNSYGMYKSYFKIGWRNFIRDKAYSFINIGGLAIGMAVAILISLWIFDELSFNTDNANYSTIALVIKNRTYNGKIHTETSQSLPQANELRTVYGRNFENVVTSSYPFLHSVKYGEKSILKRGLYMEEGGQDILDLKIISGLLNQTLEPFSILVSESVAASLFTGENPVGKIVRLDDKVDVKISGIYKDFPHGSTFREIGIYGSMKLFETTDSWVKDSREHWDVNAFPIYVRIIPQTNFEAVSSSIQHIAVQHTKDDTNPELFLYPMRKWHLYPDFKDGENTEAGMSYLWSFGIIGIFVLILACINFMNLSTARYEKRMKEIGIRKALGSGRGELVTQFYIETFLYVSSGIFLSIILVNLALPWLNEVANKRITSLLFNPLFWSVVLSFGVVTGILAGSYPAFFLSSFNPANVLKGKLLTAKHSVKPRKVLVVVQFGISITLIIAALIVNEQVQFVKNRPIGYEKEGMIYIQRRSPAFNKHYESFKRDLLDSRKVVDMSQSSAPINESWFSSSDFGWQGKDPEYKEDFVTLAVSFDFGETVSWKLLQGRDFSPQFSTDSSAMIINESALKIIGKQNPLNETITWEGTNYQVIGVINDLLLDSPYESIKPMVFILRKGNLNFINMRLNPDITIQDAIAGIESIYKKYNSSEPFDFRFASDQHNLKFRREEQIAKLSLVFSSLAIFISCMGIFGLASFMTEQRTKEIGVRKVLGATLFNLCQLLSIDFIILVLISYFIALPCAYYLMHNWLLNYEYHTEISLLIFLFTGIGALAITLLTVSYHSIKAGLMNPVKSLKSE